MSIDPKAAAAAAQAAAEAAKAAAAEAAREAAIAAAKAEAAQAQATTTGGATDPMISAPAEGAHAGEDLTGLAEPHVEGSVLDDATSRVGALAGDRTGLLDLPGLEMATASDIGGADLGDLPLGSAAPSGGDIGKADVADGMGWIGVKNVLAGIFIDTPAWAMKEAAKQVGDALEPYFDGPADGPTTTGEVDGGTPDPDETSGGTDGASDPDPDAGTPDEGDEDDPDSAGTSGANAGGTTGATAGGDRPSDDAPVTLPPGWINPDDLDFIPDERKTGGIVAGATGQDPNAGGDTAGQPGPQAGGWAVNPGSEGTMDQVGRHTSLRDAEAWYGGVSQPSPVDDPTLAVDPSKLEAQVGVDPNTVNPSGGEGTSSDSEAQASTAYRAMPAMAGDGGTGGASETAGPAGTSQASIGGETTLNETMPVQEEGALTGAAAESDAARAMPFGAGSMVDEDASFDPDREQRGREWGQSHGQGHGRGGRGAGEDDRDISTGHDDLGDSPA